MNPDTDPKQISALGQIWAAVAATVVLGVLCCGAYPLIVWGIGQAAFPHQANGSLLKRDGGNTTVDSEAVGSALLGQNFSKPEYFHPRPSAAGSGYDATASSGSNLGPLSDKLINGATQPPAPATQPTTQPAVETLAYDGIRLRTIHYAVDNGLAFDLLRGAATVPVKQFQDAQGNLNDVALVDAFPHPATDAADRAVLIAANFKDAKGAPVLIPPDAVTASGSGLDPHISPANAALQAGRIAAARHVSVDQINMLIAHNTDGPSLGIFGDAGVNVLKLNLALDAQYPMLTGK